MKFWERLKQKVDDSPLTQGEIAERARKVPGGERCSQQTISAIIKRKEENSKYSYPLSVALEVSERWLVHGIGEVQGHPATITVTSNEDEEWAAKTLEDKQLALRLLAAVPSPKAAVRNLKKNRNLSPASKKSVTNARRKGKK